MCVMRIRAVAAICKCQGPIRLTLRTRRRPLNSALKDLGNQLQKLAYSFATALVVLGITSAQAETVMQQHEYELGRKVILEDGSKVQYLPWAIGSAQNIVELRIPFAYAGALGVPSSTLTTKGYIAPEHPYSVAFSLTALLPDLAPRTAENVRDFSARGGGATVSIDVASAFAGKLQGGPRVFEIARDIQLDMLIMVPAEIRHQYRIVDKGAAHGLRRYGPAPIDDYLKLRGARDYFIVGDEIAKSADILFCDALEVKGRDEDPKSYRVPHCEHLFFLPAIDARVRLYYRRVYFSMWREIKEKAETLLRSFIVPK